MRRRGAVLLFAVLLLVTAHAVWDFAESRRLFAAIDDLRRRGEPVSRNALGRWQRPTDEQEIKAARYYNAAGELAFRDWTLVHPVANLPNHEPIRRARMDFEQIAKTRDLRADAAASFERLVADYADALEMMDRAAGLPFSRFPPHAFEDYPRTYSLENLALAGSARAVLFASRGDAEAAARALWSALKLRRAHVRTVPWESDYIVELQYLLEHARPPSALLQQLQEAYKERERPNATARELREARAVGIESLLQDWYGRRSDPLTPAANVRWGWAPLLPFRPWVAHQATGVIRESQAAVDAALRPWPQRIDALTVVARRQPDASNFRGRPTFRQFGYFIIGGVASTGILRDAASLAGARAAVSALSVERFRRDHNRLPRSLDELVPQYLDAPPEDPFTGQPMKYLADARRFVVYSVGPDGQDDGAAVGPLATLRWKITTKDVGLEIRTLYTQEER